MEQSKLMARLAYQALDDKKGEDIQVIDISQVSVLADYFIIANGTNQNQLQAMRDAADEALYKAGVKVQQIEGNQSSTWILMDYGDIIIHIFSKEDRLFYDLERTWRDGKVVDVTHDSMVIELTGHQDKLDAFLDLLSGYEILELARTGLTGLSRGISDVVMLDEDGKRVSL